jgi:hypothetical protein
MGYYRQFPLACGGSSNGTFCGSGCCVQFNGACSDRI